MIDSKNRDHIIKELIPCSLTEKNQDLMIDRLSFDPVTGTTTNKRIYIKDGHRFDAPFTMYAYHYTELARMVSEIGFQIEQVFGSWRGEAFHQDSRRIMLLLRKP